MKISVFLNLPKQSIAWLSRNTTLRLSSTTLQAYLEKISGGLVVLNNVQHSMIEKDTFSMKELFIFLGPASGRGHAVGHALSRLPRDQLIMFRLPGCR